MINLRANFFIRGSPMIGRYTGESPLSAAHLNKRWAMSVNDCVQSVKYI